LAVAPLDDEDDDAWARLQFRQLQAMAAVGVKIVQALSDQVDLAHQDPEALHRLALTHARIARSVRQTHALEARLRRDLKARPDWSLWRREPWAVAELRDRPLGSHYVRLHDDLVARGLWEDERAERQDLDPAIHRDTHPPP